LTTRKETVMSKMDVTITLTSDVLKPYNIEGTHDVIVDLDYCSDMDDVIQAIEERIWTDLNVICHFGVDFEIDEKMDIEISKALGWTDADEEDED
jgi:hypothetical protein